MYILWGFALLCCLAATAAAEDVVFSGTFQNSLYERWTDLSCEPNTTPVTFNIWVDISGIEQDEYAMIGLVDKKQRDEAAYDTFHEDWGSGAYLYIERFADRVRIGTLDGSYFGFDDSEGIDIILSDELLVNGILVSMQIHANTITVGYEDQVLNFQETVAGPYGDIKDAYYAATQGDTDFYSWNEFEFGAYFAIESTDYSNSVNYVVTVSGCGDDSGYESFRQCVAAEITASCDDAGGFEQIGCFIEQYAMCRDMFDIPYHNIFHCILAEKRAHCSQMDRAERRGCVAERIGYCREMFGDFL